MPEQRILIAAAGMPAGAAVTGWAACRWLGAGFHDGLEPDGRTPTDVSIAMGAHGHAHVRAGVRASYTGLPVWETWLCRGLCVTRAERAVVDAMREAGGLRAAVVALEMAYAAELTSPARIRAYLRSRPRMVGIGPLPLAVELAGEHSRSPQESWLRLVAELDAGLPRLLVNCPIHSRGGRLLGIADLLDLEAGLVIEYDGAEHRSIRRHTADVRKDDAFRSLGIEVVRVVGTDLHVPDRVVGRIRRGRERAHFSAEADRLWVPRPPRDDLEERLREAEATAMVQQWWLEQTG